VGAPHQYSHLRVSVLTGPFSVPGAVASPVCLGPDHLVWCSGTHGHPNVKAWLGKHPRFKLHFTPTGSSWLNLVERWFGEITRKRIRRGVFKSVPELVAAVEEYIRHHNEDPKPFVWSKRAEDIVKKVSNCKAVFETLH
jgi:hypothetical protein